MDRHGVDLWPGHRPVFETRDVSEAGVLVFLGGGGKSGVNYGVLPAFQTAFSSGCKYGYQPSFFAIIAYCSAAFSSLSFFCNCKKSRAGMRRTGISYSVGFFTHLTLSHLSPSVELAGNQL